jgi:hypothetical protein
MIVAVNQFLLFHLSLSPSKNAGAGALTKLLLLLDDKNSDVRLTAASIAYMANSDRCRRVLIELMKIPDHLGVAA